MSTMVSVYCCHRHVYPRASWGDIKERRCPAWSSLAASGRSGSPSVTIFRPSAVSLE
jgi:hypothetical protein